MATSATPDDQRLSGPLAWIDPAALRHNLARVHQAAPHSRIWAVIKANAYGHGMEQAADALDRADGFAVARVAEALRLRRHGVRQPILVLEGIGDGAELDAATAGRLTLVLHDSWQLEQIVAFLGRQPAPLAERLPLLRVWLKVDTGMGRLGVAASAVAGLLERLAALAPAVAVEGLMTHLANADDPGHALTPAQCEQAHALAARHPLPLSIGNSAGLLAHPRARTDWVRPGIMLYGGTPLLTATAAGLDLRPAMTLTSPLIAVRTLRRDATVGYGSSYRCPEEMPVGIVAIGYADGYPRHTPGGTPMLIRGQRAPLIGRVSMDMIAVDLRTVPAAAVGDPVTLWGAGLPVEEIAAQVGTINYELLCRLSARVRLCYPTPTTAPGQTP
ncbi:MAG: alanine racemase [Chromatiaceae bacterium]|nr:MAG: alanine racemase [Chromatiaceae bacterium]